ncbi:MAG: hypothetical protein AAFN44_16650 [Pseudomonadota bacterium]
MPAARPTEAALARAIAATRRAGGGIVEVTDAGIRIVVNGDSLGVSLPEQEGNPWDKATERTAT